nr:hypothetical protein [Klebsiella aerogenes]
MNQPMSFVWNTEAASLAKKAGATGGISETGAYEGFITSAIYTFGKEGSQSQALELSLDSDGAKANYLRINYIGKDGQQTFGMGLISALLWLPRLRALSQNRCKPKMVLSGIARHWSARKLACSCRRFCTPKAMELTAINSKSATFPTWLASHLCRIQRKRSGNRYRCPGKVDER